MRLSSISVMVPIISKNTVTKGRCTHERENTKQMNTEQKNTKQKNTHQKNMHQKYTYRELSAFCLQVSLLLKAAVPLDEGLRIMAEDGADEDEKKRLLFLADEIELGAPVFEALEKTESFPEYVIKMAKLGDQTGTLDQMMESLSVYYDKEDRMIQNIRNAVTYPVMMVLMLLVVLFVLFTKVMPIFEEVYEQLGTQISPVSQAAIRLGGAFSGIAIVAAAVAAAAVLGLYIASKFGKRLHVAERAVERFKRTNKTALLAAKRRCTSVLALTLKSGLELEKGIELAEELAGNGSIQECLLKCKDDLETGKGYDEAMKESGLFNGFQIQMIKVGSRSGRLDRVMEEISRGYEEEADASIDNTISRLEPTIVAVLAVSVGLVLLSVMLPLVGILSAIG